jgi:hypothetical protein
MSLARTSALLFVVAICVLTPSAAAGDIVFSPPQLLPGDMASGLADGHQREMEIATGGGGSLVVWSDMRSSLDNFQGLDGSGLDIYGSLLDAAGNVIKCFMINEGPGDQVLPHVAWNGSNWLVAWSEPTPAGLPVYERVRAVRVAPDGTVLDATPILIHQESWGCYCSYAGLAIAGGGADGWVVVVDAPPIGPTGIPQGLIAVRVQADGIVANPEGLLVKEQMGSLAFDIAFAGDEYMIVFGTGTNAAAKRYSPTLDFLGSTALPFAKEVATDGNNFLVIGQWFYSWPPKLEATLLAHDGSVLVERFTVATGDAVSGPNGERVGFGGTEYWVTWASDQFARVTTDGQLLDPEGFIIGGSVTGNFGWEPALDAAPGGGLQIAWRDGGGGQGNPQDVYSARITPAGQAVNQTPISVSAPAQVEPDFAEGAGVNVLVFRSRSSGAARILAQRLDVNGVALDPEPIEVASGPVDWLTTPSIGAPQVAWNGSAFMVAWSDTINVLARRMNPDGTFVDATPLVVMTGQHAGVGALGANFLLSGTTVGTLLSTGALRVARVDGVTGAVLDAPPITLSSVSLAGQFPHIETLGDRWLVVWESVYRDPWSTTVIESTAIAFVAADGTTTGQLGAGLSERPGVGVSGDRALLVAIDTTVPGGATDLEARILMADGTFLGPMFTLSTAYDEQLWPTATWDGTQFIAAWEDKRNSVIHFDERTDIYGARVTADGVVLDPAGIPLVAEPEVEIRPAFLTTGGTTLMAVSTLRSDDASTAAFRIGIHTLLGEQTFTDLGNGLAGTNGMPSLNGSGSMAGGDAVTMTLSGARELAPTTLVIGLAELGVPFKGGVMVPYPTLLIGGLTTDATGALALGGTLPGATPSGFALFLQAWIADVAGPVGLAASNGLKATTP